MVFYSYHIIYTRMHVLLCVCCDARSNRDLPFCVLTQMVEHYCLWYQHHFFRFAGLWVAIARSTNHTKKGDESVCTIFGCKWYCENQWLTAILSISLYVPLWIEWCGDDDDNNNGDENNDTLEIADKWPSLVSPFCRRCVYDRYVYG